MSRNLLFRVEKISSKSECMIRIEMRILATNATTVVFMWSICKLCVERTNNDDILIGCYSHYLVSLVSGAYKYFAVFTSSWRIS